MDITLEQRRGAEEEFLAQGIYSFLAWDAQIVWMTPLCFQNILVASIRNALLFPRDDPDPIS